uniref:Chromosome 16 open reading frame 89 n=1 Tax=Cyprinodon variegatus TaxID=28743 RepID=A0A3Q2CF47_CYPVA
DLKHLKKMFLIFFRVQAELKEAVRTWPHTDPLSWAQRTTAVTLLNRLDQSLEKAVAALKLNDPKYYREFEPLLTWTFWTIPQEWRTTDPSLVYPSTLTSECYDEQLSDKCLTLLLGTWKMNGTPCIVTKPCRDTMTRFGCPCYSLSHQLNVKTSFLFFLFAVLICGLAGFSDFHKTDWLQHILRLQDDEVGCFGRDSEYLVFSQELLRNGCSSHMTAVAVGALGGYLNFHLTEQDITKRPLS